MKKIYLVRHGQTDYNLNEIVQGSTDSELNETGISQAYEAKEKLKNVNIDKIYSSPLKRAKKTAEIINENWNKEIILDERLKEICFGVNEGHKYGTYDHENFWNYKNPVIPDEAEDVRDFVKRVSEFLDDLKKTEGNSILLVAHGGVIKAVKAYLYGIPEDGNLNYESSRNCEIFEFEI